VNKFKYITTFAIGFTYLITQSFAASPNLQTTIQQADQGDAEAQYNLDLMYYKGQGVPPDGGKAVEYYKKSC